jgi:sucrose phosphatase-like protein
VERMKLLISDLDGTLLGDDSALDAFHDWYDRTNGQIGLVYSSGRFLNSIVASIEEFRLPKPAAIIGGVGTEIYDNLAGRRIAGWPRIPFGWNPEIVRSTCAAFSELQEQPQHLSSRCKISFYASELDDVFLARLSNALHRAGQAVAIVYSSRRDLDILPAGSNKGAAIVYLVERWGISRDDLIVAGDSGNDRDMFQQGCRGIVVGNAQPELRQLRDANIYHAEQSHAAGVIEGLEYWLGESCAAL